MTKKTHILYSIISLCAVIAYCGFLVKNSITEVDTVEETLPYDKEEVFLPDEEPSASVVAQIQSDVPRVVYEEPSEPTEESPAPAQEEYETFITGFSPIMPVQGTITKHFSQKHIFNEKTGDWRAHTGIDIEAAPADAVLATEDGAVVACYTDPLWGNVIEIDHGEYISIYKNLSTLIMVNVGDSVTRGERISGVGETSATESGSAHIHFELLRFGEFIDPVSLIS